MIGKLTGTLLEKSPPQVLVDCHGVGYEVDVPMSTFYNLPANGEKVTLLTHFAVREDGHYLYGFLSEADSPVLFGALLLLGINMAMGLLCYALLRRGWKIRN